MKISKKAALMVLILLFPVSGMAMVPVSDAALGDVTGRSGVNINADVRMNIGIDIVAWGDSDGIGALTSYGWATGSSGGFVGVNGLDINNLRIKARETDTFGGYLATGTTANRLKPITIDVATDDTLVINNGYTFVRIGLGSLEVSMDWMSFGVSLWPRSGANQLLGTVNMGDMALYINPASFVDIYNSRPFMRRGITLSMDVRFDRFELGYLSWGDTDGVGNSGIGTCIWMSPAATSAGYVGLSNLVVAGPITVTGTVLIDVNTSYNGIYSHGQVGVTPGAAPTSVVHIGFPSMFSITANGIYADVKLDSTPWLGSANSGTLGDIFLTGLSLNVLPGSWVDVWAH